jgi:hypothetical protein
MISMGLSKFQGEVVHNGTWKPRWVWDADHDLWSKGDLTNFRWSIMQPYTNKAGLAELTNGEWIVEGTKDTSLTLQAANVPGPGTHDSTVTRTIPKWVYCGDCHYPHQPALPDSVLGSLMKNLSGSLELDRIQLVRRPQIKGGSILATSTDTTTKK